MMDFIHLDSIIFGPPDEHGPWNISQSYLPHDEDGSIACISSSHETNYIFLPLLVVKE